MSTFAIEGREQLGRWTISVAIALVLHGAVAAALLNWARSNFSISPASVPVINIDLTPFVRDPLPGQAHNVTPPLSPVAEPFTAASPTALATPAPLVPGAAGQATKADEENKAEGGAIGGGTPARAEPTGARGGAAIDENPLPRSDMNAMPLDTSVTVTPGLYGKKAGGMAWQKKNTMLLRPSKHLLHEPQQTRNLGAASGISPRTNAIGAHVQDRAKAALARAASRGEIRNAVGGVAAPGASTGIAGSGANVEGSKNSIGVTMPIRPNTPAVRAGEPKTVAASPAAATVVNHAAIGGRDIVHSTGRNGALGGPAKSTAGVLNGTDFHGRHP
jgi:hypothetical protein